ncbi:hypothetical protein E4U55_007805 [Claviceps digitariae]|nr:hypothetical protein E4U55_007805 [Claviceps digitariae]
MDLSDMTGQTIERRNRTVLVLKIICSYVALCGIKLWQSPAAQFYFVGKANDSAYLIPRGGLFRALAKLFLKQGVEDVGQSLVVDKWVVMRTFIVTNSSHSPAFTSRVMTYQIV